MIFHEAFGRALAEHGIDVAFGVIGDANLFVMDSFGRHGGGRYVAMANEAGAVLAANGYAAATGGLGVATVTHGPGLTNTVTALVEGVRSRTPVLLIAGDTAASERQALQRIAQREVVAAAGAIFEQIYAPQSYNEDLNRAVRTALLQRCPVVLNLPAEFQWAAVEVQTGLPAALPTRQAVAADPAALDAAVGLIASARRPIVLAGRGVCSPDERATLLHFAKQIGAPVATTLRGKDLFRGAPANLGIFGTFSSEATVQAIQRADCIVAVGASLNGYTTAEGSFLADKKVVHVDVDERALSHDYHVDQPVLGDGKTVIEQISAMLDAAEITPSRFADELADGSPVAPALPPIDNTPGTVNLFGTVARLDAALPVDRAVVLDAGRFLVAALTGLQVPEPRAYIPTFNYGSIGLGMATAIGAAHAAPDRPVVMVCGDGGFMLGGLAEFNSAVRHRCDIIVVLFNDGAYGAEHIQFTMREMDPTVSTFQWPEFAAVADSLGAKGYTVRSGEDLERVLAEIGDRDGPVLIDIKIDPNSINASDH
ncbi:thiamine pyrophosphate-binding protein [Mycolicibacterium pyrenivorans]|uniref:thiamine pyrophosphate-binding protein n=1 Tax=Mycolicibacterium pyrenivorans TaxID=187102 RepID=UPI0021F37E1A|nr:thiamine pyrophosphate-binding protein [Mycolicibacterium pyrenivorans]MCV7154782.1 thiamine pyrophosphate-binding protein [Mycolicibacterium pyrenivorans]